MPPFGFVVVLDDEGLVGGARRRLAAGEIGIAMAKKISDSA